ncbi:heme peroxidase, partial [Mycena olivaceomarginata]
YPSWSNQETYDHTCFVTTAFNVKVHAVEWTPALLQNEVLLHGMKANWHGLLPDPVKRFLSCFVPQTVSKALFGIVSSSPNFTGMPFSHSEEFVSIYRFYSLLPNMLMIHDHLTSQHTDKMYDIAQYSFCSAKDVIYDNRFSNVIFTFGVDYPGALILNNFPEGLMSLNKLSKEQVLNMGTIDVPHNREHSIPQYNKFWCCFSLIPAKTRHQQ